MSTSYESTKRKHRRYYNQLPIEQYLKLEKEAHERELSPFELSSMIVYNWLEENRRIDESDFMSKLTRFRKAASDDMDRLHKLGKDAGVAEGKASAYSHAMQLLVGTGHSPEEEFLP